MDRVADKKILGAILAGGRSSRFGSDKSQALWAGLTLIDHVMVRLGSVASGIIVCGADHDRVISVADRPSPDLGPLGGLNAALHHAAANGYDRVIAVPCDTPILDDSLLKLLASIEGDAFLADMPVIGSWQSAHASLLDEHLRSASDRSMRSWARIIGADPLPRPAPPNINRPGDLKMLG